MSDPSWWKKTLKSIHPLRDEDLMDIDEDIMKTNDDMMKQACHPFYATVLGEDGFVDEVTTECIHTSLALRCSIPDIRM